MNAYYDLHIHSALSPCADNDMTPNNIVNMALLKGLDVIAVCDHNCAANLPAIAAVAEKSGIVLLPGLELNTAEEVHLLVFFDALEPAVAFGERLYTSLPDIKNDPLFFGNQFLLDEKDEIVGEREKLLLSALPYSMEECCNLAHRAGGVVVPAHINKESNSILSNLGFLPPQPHFSSIEFYPEGLAMDPAGYTVLRDSDAHTLSQIAERTSFLAVEEMSARGVLRSLV